MGQCEKILVYCGSRVKLQRYIPYSVAFLSICPSFHLSVTTTLYVCRVDDCLCGDIRLICIDTMLAEIVRDVTYYMALM